MNSLDEQIETQGKLSESTSVSLFGENSEIFFGLEMLRLMHDIIQDDHCIVDTIICPGFSTVEEIDGELVAIDGVKHYDIRVNIAAKEKALDFDVVSSEILRPMAEKLAAIIKDLGGEYVLVPLDLIDGSRSSVVYDKNIGVRLELGFDPKYLQNFLAFDICLVQKRTPECMAEEIKQREV